MEVYYIVLAIAVLGGGIVLLVNYIKHVFPQQAVRFFVMFLSGLISLVSVMLAYHRANILSVGGTAGALYLVSQIYYEVGPVLLKWFTQKQPLTVNQLETDGEKALADVEKTLSGATPEAQV
jgi:hypothetical protein